MSHDILRESSIYQEIVEQGRQVGIEQGKIQGKRESLLFLVQERFPDALTLAKQQLESVTDAEILHEILFKLADAQTVEDAKRIFLELGDSKNKH